MTVKVRSLDSLRDEYRSARCELLSTDYNGVKTPMEYICQCGHKHTMPYYCFHRGQGRKCPACSGNQRKTIEEVREIFRDNGCELITNEYKWNRQKLTYIARCGHEHTIKASAFFEGEGRLCPKCQGLVNSNAIRKHDDCYYIEMFKKANCTLLSRNITTNSRVRYIASCGHEDEITIQYFKQGYGIVCHNCCKKNVSKGELQIKEVLEKFGIRYVAQFRIKTRDRSFQRLDFYLPDFNSAIEFNGRQHYEKNEFFHHHRKYKCTTFESQVERDLRKRKWCRDNGIELYEIDARRWSTKTIFKGLLKSFVEGLCINNGWCKIEV